MMFPRNRKTGKASFSLCFVFEMNIDAQRFIHFEDAVSVASRFDSDADRFGIFSVRGELSDYQY